MNAVIPSLKLFSLCRVNTKNMIVEYRKSVYVLFRGPNVNQIEKVKPFGQRLIFPKQSFA